MAPKKSRKVKRSIPWALHMAIVRLQGVEELEYDEACIRAAALIEEGGDGYRDAVKAEANRLYKSRFMEEQNKARNTWQRRGYDKGFGEGKKEGFEIGRKAYQIKYPCARCGEDTEAAVGFLKSKEWGHSNCPGASKT